MFLTNVQRAILYSQTGGVRAMTFNSDGRSIFCGLHESMKVTIYRRFVFFQYAQTMLYCFRPKTDSC
jgi:hypothetical protein